MHFILINKIHFLKNSLKENETRVQHRTASLNSNSHIFISTTHGV